MGNLRRRTACQKKWQAQEQTEELKRELSHVILGGKKVSGRLGRPWRCVTAGIRCRGIGTTPPIPPTPPTYVTRGPATANAEAIL